MKGGLISTPPNKEIKSISHLRRKEHHRRERRKMKIEEKEGNEFMLKEKDRKGYVPLTKFGLSDQVRERKDDLSNT